MCDDVDCFIWHIEAQRYALFEFNNVSSSIVKLYRSNRTIHRVGDPSSFSVVNINNSTKQSHHTHC